MENKRHNNEINKSNNLTRFALKNIALIAMVIDHIAFMFFTINGTNNIFLNFLNYIFPNNNNKDLVLVFYTIFRTIGKLTCPIMCFFLAQGYIYTRSKLKYALRLLIFAILSQWIYINAFNLDFSIFSLKSMHLNMMFTLFLGFIAMYVCDKIKNKLLKAICLIGILITSTICDWEYWAILWILNFYIYSKDKNKMINNTIIIDSLFIIIQFLKNYTYMINWQLKMALAVPLFGVFIPLFLINKYNGQKGKDFNIKYLYYIFYPGHLYILYFLAKFFNIR